MIIPASLTILLPFSFLFGICIGSFLNVCIYRIPAGKSIVSPPSACPNCDTSIPFYCNIPIFSYLILKGRCKFCENPISVRYPMIEALTGIFAVLLCLKFGPSPQMLYWFIFVCTLITVSFIDFDHQIIPDIISLPGIIVFASSFYFVPGMTVKSAFLGIFLGGGSLIVVSLGYYLLRRQEGMGMGDIKLLAMIGAALGPQGVLFTIFAGSLIGTMIGLTTILTSKKSNMKLKIPFGPYLSMGAVLYLFFGHEIIVWYFGLLAP